MVATGSVAAPTREHGSLGNLGPQGHVLLGVLQEIHKLHNLDLGLFTAGNVPGNTGMSASTPNHNYPFSSNQWRALVSRGLHT